ncbi:MAG: amino acid permease [Candidatus Freyarchaeota archaeon]
MSGKDSSSGGSKGRRIVFTRDATGLVREISILDAVVVVFTFIVGGGIMFMSVQSLAPGYFPGGNLSMGYLLALFLWLPIALLYAILSRAMPRSGGDYVFVSRILGPGYGFLASWGVWIMLMFTVGVLCFQAVSFVSLFTMYYGLMTYDLGLLHHSPAGRFGCVMDPLHPLSDGHALGLEQHLRLGSEPLRRLRRPLQAGFSALLVALRF